LIDDTLDTNAARGGAGGSGGVGGNGGFAGGLTGFAQLGDGGSPLISHFVTSTSLGGGGGTGLSGGPGGPGGNGGRAQGGGLYVASGTLTLANVTVAANSVQGGSSGSGGSGGKGGSFGLGNGPPGAPGNPGDSYGGGLYLNGGTISFFNSTIALNSQTGGGQVGGVDNVSGKVTALSTLFAGNGPVDYSGKVTAKYCLFQTKPIHATVDTKVNLVGVNPKLNSHGLQDNGGLTQTIALQASSPALGKGSNPENLFTDQRGYAPRSGKSGSTDIGAYQHDASADTSAPTASLSAPNVDSSSGATSYTFTITYQDNVAVAAATVPGALVEVVPPGEGDPITATLISTSSTGSTDSLGDAQGLVVTYRITPPGGAWSAADDGTYAVTLGGSPISDLAGNSVATGTLGTFTVQTVPDQLIITSQPPSTVTAGIAFPVTVKVENSQGQVQTNYSGSVTMALASNPAGGTLYGTLTLKANHGVVTFSSLTLRKAGAGYTLEASSNGLTSAITNSFAVAPGAAKNLVVITQPPASVAAGRGFRVIVAAEDKFGNVATSFGGTITMALGRNPGGSTLHGTLTVTASKGRATFGGLWLNKAGVGYTLVASDNGLTSATTNSFAVVPGAAKKLVVTAQPPARVAVGSPFGLTLAVEDAYGNVLNTDDTGSFTVALATNPGGATLTGTLTVTVTDGIITFSGLRLNKPGIGYKLVVTGGGLHTATTNAFDVT
jgi:hypothetical protein